MCVCGGGGVIQTSHVFRPGIEPGSTAWKSRALTTQPATHIEGGREREKEGETMRERDKEKDGVTM